MRPLAQQPCLPYVGKEVDFDEERKSKNIERDANDIQISEMPEMLHECLDARSFGASAFTSLSCQMPAPDSLASTCTIRTSKSQATARCYA